MLLLFTKLWRRHRLQYCLSVLLTVLSLGAASDVVAEQMSLTLTEATQRALANSPELEVFQKRYQIIEGMRQTAKLRPAFELGIDVENVAGSGDFSGVDSAELTLSLSSVIELGDKRDSRVARSEERRVGKECRSRWSADH